MGIRVHLGFQQETIHVHENENAGNYACPQHI